MLPLAFMLFGIGIVLVIVELFIPSMGVLATASGACFVAAIVMGFSVSTGWGLGMLGGVIVVVPILLLLGFKVFPHTPIGRRLILAGPDRSEVERGSDVSSESLHDLLGRTGRAISTLRPAGLVEIDGRRVDVITSGEWIDAGQPIVVSEVEGNRAVVRVAESDSGTGDPTS